MNEMNLLPLWAIRRQNRRRLWIRVLLAEAVVFLLTAALIGSCRLYVRHLRVQVNALESRLTDPLYTEADRLAEQVKIAEAAASERLELYTALPNDWFNNEWLHTALQTMPEGVSLITLEIIETRLTLTAETQDLRLAEQHRIQLTETGLFSAALYGMSALRDNGIYRYTLVLEVEE